MEVDLECKICLRLPIDAFSCGNCSYLVCGTCQKKCDQVCPTCTATNTIFPCPVAKYNVLKIIQSRSDNHTYELFGESPLMPQPSSRHLLIMELEDDESIFSESSFTKKVGYNMMTSRLSRSLTPHSQLEF